MTVQPSPVGDVAEETTMPAFTRGPIGRPLPSHQSELPSAGPGLQDADTALRQCLEEFRAEHAAVLSLLRAEVSRLRDVAGLEAWPRGGVTATAHSEATASTRIEVAMAPREGAAAPP